MLSPLARLLHLRSKLRFGPFVPGTSDFLHDCRPWDPGSSATEDGDSPSPRKSTDAGGLELLQPERQTDIHPAGEDREPTDHPDDRERTAVGLGPDEDDEGNHQRAVN